MAPIPYAPLGTLSNSDVDCVEQRTGKAFGRDYRYYVARMKDGSEWRLRSVTTVLGCLNKEALIQWAVDRSMDYIRETLLPGEDGHIRVSPNMLDAVLSQARMAHYRSKTEAAELGTLAHDYIEGYLRTGIEPDLRDQDSRVINCYTLFRRWWDDQQLSVIQTELMVYDVAHGYAGTLDFLAADRNGDLVLVDWKTSKSIYWNYRLQVIAYARALSQMGRGLPKRASIVRIGKEDADFEVLDIPREDWPGLRDLFLSCVPLSDALSAAEGDYRKRNRN